MIRPREDRSFVRYRKTGDPRLLAMVFDRTAGELFAVAAHLCRDRHAAEDAVQSTFLTAIEDRQQWDATRPLLPWLLGILVNRVRSQRRTVQRELAAALPEPATTPDPGFVAQQTEFATATKSAIARLDEPYRDAVRRHLLLGQPAHEIATELGVAAGTVRMRLHRGIAELRRRLPRGFGPGAGVAVAAVLSDGARAAMRRVVLQHGGHGVEVAAVGSNATLLASIGVLLMKKSALAVLAGLAVLAAASWQLLTPSHDGTNLAPQSIVVAQTTRKIADAPTTEPVADARGTEAVRTAAPRAVTAPPKGRLKVVMRYGTTKAPLPGVDLEVVVRHPGTKQLAAHDLRRTGADGIATFDIAAGSATIQERLHFDSKPLPAEIRAGEETELVVDLQPQLDTEIIVVDADDVAVADASILGRTFEDIGQLVERELGRTGRDGRCRLSFLDGSVAVRAVKAGLQASPVFTLHRNAQRATLRLMSGPATIAGTVFDRSGRPLPQTTVALQSIVDGEQGKQPIAAVTDAAGRFVCTYVPPGQIEVLALQNSQKSSMIARKRCRAIAGERTDVELRFDGNARLEVAVRGEDGKPIAKAPLAAAIRLEREIYPHLGILVTAETDELGVAVFADLAEGTYEVQSWSPRMTKRETVTIAAGEQRRLDWGVSAPTHVAVHVEDANGTSLPDWTVVLVPGSGTTATATTDDRGDCRFDDVAGNGEYRLAVSAKDAVTSAFVPARLGERNVIRIDSDAMPTASIRVRARASDPTLLQNAQVEMQLPRINSVRRAPLAADGTVVLDRLPADTYAVAVRRTDTKEYLCAPQHVQVTRGADVEVVFDLFLAATLRIALSCADGGKVRGARLGLAEVTRPRYFGFVNNGAGGDLEIPGMPAGRFEALVWGEDIAPVFVPVVTRGVPLEVPVQALRGVPTTFRLRGARTDGEFALQQNGAELLRLRLRDETALTLGLRPGTYAAILEHESRRGSATFTVGATSGAAIELALPA